MTTWKSSTKFIAVGAFILLLILSLTLGRVILAMGIGAERIAGVNRYDTAAQIAQEKYEESETVIIARGDEEGEYADGLAGSTLAGALDAPILTVEPESLPEETANAINNLNAEEVIILGGTGAIAEEVEEELIEELDIEEGNVNRIAGQNRMETAAFIAREAAGMAGDAGAFGNANQPAGAFDGNGDEVDNPLADYAFVVNGSAPADSLVAGPMAAADTAAILQVTTDGQKVPQVTKEAISALGIERIKIIGGSAVVSKKAEDHLQTIDGIEANNISRYSGEDRFATSVEVAEKFFDEPENFIFAGGADERLADALAGGYLGAGLEAPILYTGSLRESVREYFEDTSRKDSMAYILGGRAAVRNRTVEEIRDIIMDQREEHINVDNVVTDHKELLNLHTFEVYPSSKVHTLELNGIEMHYEGDNHFSLATTSISSGGKAVIVAYDADGNVLEARGVFVD